MKLCMLLVTLMSDPHMGHCNGVRCLDWREPVRLTAQQRPTWVRLNDQLSCLAVREG